MNHKMIEAVIGLAAIVLTVGPTLAGKTASALSSLESYVNHYPSDKVRGTAFLADSRVIAAVHAAVRDPDIRRDVLEAKDVVETPILALSAGRLFTRSYDPVGGGSTNWAILITGDGGKAAVCYSTDAVYGDGKSIWYYGGGEVLVQEGPCPSEQGDVESRFGSWPVGAIPG